MCQSKKKQIHRSYPSKSLRLPSMKLLHAETLSHSECLRKCLSHARVLGAFISCNHVASLSSCAVVLRKGWCRSECHAHTSSRIKLMILNCIGNICSFSVDEAQRFESDEKCVVRLVGSSFKRVLIFRCEIHFWSKSNGVEKHRCAVLPIPCFPTQGERDMVDAHL